MYIHETNVHNTRAAEIVVPLIIDLFKPNNVLDIGCGIGTWLNVFKKNGVSIIGLDGDYVNRKLLHENITSEEFQPIDLTKPFNLNKKFDLVICLEVAEHLPTNVATTFVESLCYHADIIVFGAAIPGQWGQNHLNEQWPNYWIDIFKKSGYRVFDLLRPQIWNNKEVEWWYKQNMLVFSKIDISNSTKAILFESIVHPEHFNQKLDYIQLISEKNANNEMNLGKWASGKMGIRKHWNSLVMAIKYKLLNK